MTKKDFLELEYTFKVIVPIDFKGVKPWGKIESIDDIIHHWLMEGYYIENGTVILPDDLYVHSAGFKSFPESWWRELIPKSRWDQEVVKLKRNKLIK